MNVYDYDEALIADLRTILKDDRIHITPHQNVTRVVARLDESEDQIIFPLVSVLRTNITLTEDNFAMRGDGEYLEYNKVTEKYVHLYAIPIKIQYQLDVYSRTREECDAMIGELIWYYRTYQTLQIEAAPPEACCISYDPPKYDSDGKELYQPYMHNFNVFVVGEVIDNSDITEFYNQGQLFRQTLTLHIDDSYLFRTNSRYATVVEYTFEAVDKIN